MAGSAREFSAEQRAAIESNADRFVVLAAAGSGKTSVLVERYAQRVIAGVAPDAILTITFTKKAAAEMKERIVAQLRSRGLIEAAQIAETGPIQTIHSFCERLLRENALACGLDPTFEVLEGPAKTALTLRAVRDAIVAAPQDSPIAERLIRDLAGKRVPFGGGPSPYRRLEVAILDAMEALRSAGCDRDRLAAAYGDIDRLAEFWEERILEDVNNDGVRQAAKEVHGGSIGTRIVEAFRIADVRLPKDYKVKATLADELASLEHTCGLVSLALAAWSNLEIAMREERLLDFTALEARAVAALESSNEVRERVAQQTPFVMVDEVQDVNPVQFRLINAIDAASRMYVGDIKQSIYAFRHADVEFFRREIEEMHQIHLTRNYRSTPGVLRYVDEFFRDHMIGYEPAMVTEPQPALDLDAEPESSVSPYEGVEHWRLEKRDWRGLAGYVAELLDEGVRPGQIAILTRDNRTAGDIQRRLDLRGIPARVIGGSERFYARLEVRDLANALRAAADPYDDFSLLAVLRSPMAELSMDGVVQLASAGGVYDALATFAFAVDDDRERVDRFLRWFEPLRRVADRLPAWEVLAAILADSRYLEALAAQTRGDQRVANARKLLTLATGQPELGPLEYAEAIREIREFRHREGEAPITAGDEDVVSVLTIHKAKGLEFDVVVLPQTDAQLVGVAGEVVIDAPRGFVVAKGGKAATLPYQHLAEFKKRREMAEAMRVLYVAMTRARQRLCVCLYPAGTKDSASKRVLAKFGDEKSSIRERNYAMQVT